MSTLRGLRRDIKELESEYERAWRKIATLEEEIERLKVELTHCGSALIASEEGACRFHCRTAKDNWIDGRLWNDDYGYTREEAEEFYNEWKRQRSSER